VLAILRAWPAAAALRFGMPGGGAAGAGAGAGAAGAAEAGELPAELALADRAPDAVLLALLEAHPLEEEAEPGTAEGVGAARQVKQAPPQLTETPHLN
jgi:hypothetical protein